MELRPFKCPECSHRAKRKQNLDNHIKNKHSILGKRKRDDSKDELIRVEVINRGMPDKKKKKIYWCGWPGCDRDDPYLSRTSLNAHIRSRHTDERPFACPHCNERFHISCNAKKHANLHCPERPEHLAKRAKLI